eukprot:jgi/Chlat1/5396/Chrsp35S05221
MVVAMAPPLQEAAAPLSSPSVRSSIAPSSIIKKRVALRFSIKFMTVWGQNLMVCGPSQVLGGGNVKKGLWMTPTHKGDELYWQATTIVTAGAPVEYQYVLVDEKMNVLKWEAGDMRKFVLPEHLKDGDVVDMYDTWQEGAAPENLLRRAAFKKVVFGNRERQIMEELPSTPSVSDSQDQVLVRFVVACAQLEPDQKVYVAGSNKVLGEWAKCSALRLYEDTPYWRGEAVFSRSHFPIRYPLMHHTYRYSLKDAEGLELHEQGPDRELVLDEKCTKRANMLVVQDSHVRMVPWRGAGVAIPVFSMRTTESVGAGEFLDLKLLVDLADTWGFRLIQLLPINDTSVHQMWWDSYPYSSLSVYALHPLYLRLQALAPDLPTDIREEIESARKELDQEHVDYEKTMQTKLRIARKVYDLHKGSDLETDEFKAFYEDNKAWLQPYAAFCFLRNLFGSSEHWNWGSYANVTSEKLDRLTAPGTDHYAAIAFQYYLQFKLHQQLLEATEYARDHRVVVKGDLPIGVDRASVDTWLYPTLFRMHMSTGAPPDYFDPNGQNWGFPTYNWEEMAKDNYAWWRSRLSQMAKYFTAYRIDHILGFFRIWEIPGHCTTGLLGRFRPSLPLTQSELESQGVWDFDRLTMPYIRWQHIQDTFGPRAHDVTLKYLEEFAPQRFRLKEEYSTEKKIVEATKVDESAPEFLRLELQVIRKGLMALRQNVALLRDPEDPHLFYPSIHMFRTSSWEELDDFNKQALRRLYQSYFFERQDELWRSNALKTLPVLMKSSDMLVCGEDLGMIPDCVPPVLNELGLLGLRIQRMPNSSTEEFGTPDEYEYLTVCAPSCHDTSTTRFWWEEDKARSGRFYAQQLHQEVGKDPPETCTPHVASLIVQQHLDSPSIWAIFPLQDLLALSDAYNNRPAKDETINDPTNPKHYWRFRVHITLEDLRRDRVFGATLQEMVLRSGRCQPTELPSLDTTP